MAGPVNPPRSGESKGTDASPLQGAVRPAPVASPGTLSRETQRDSLKHSLSGLRADIGLVSKNPDERQMGELIGAYEAELVGPRCKELLSDAERDGEKKKLLDMLNEVVRNRDLYPHVIYPVGYIEWLNERIRKLRVGVKETEPITETFAEAASREATEHIQTYLESLRLTFRRMSDHVGDAEMNATMRDAWLSLIDEQIRKLVTPREAAEALNSVADILDVSERNYVAAGAVKVAVDVERIAKSYRKRAQETLEKSGIGSGT